MNSFLTNLLSICGIEYLIIDENLKILEISLGINHFANISDEVKLGQDVRTPISSVMGMASLLLDTELTAEQQNFIEIIYSSGNSLLKIINDCEKLRKQW